MMEFPMELDTWSLSFGDQLQHFDADLSTFDLLGGRRSGGCEYPVFDVDVADHRQDVLTPALWSDDYDYGKNSGYGLTPSPLASSPEQQHDLFAMFPGNIFEPTKYEPISAQVHLPPTPSPIPELPASPEDYFAETGVVAPVTAHVPVTFGGGIGTAEISEKAVELELAECDRVEVLPLVPDVCVGDVEHDTEDLLFELDDVDVGDVIIDHAKLASIGPSLPSFSLDDVLSLLSTEVPSVVTATPTPALPPTASFTTFSSALSEPTIMTPIYLMPVASPDSNSSLEFSDSANSPGSSAVSSPASRDSGVGPVKATTERRQRKKEQNKTAAQRYREKKRADHGTVLSEYELLEQRNTELRSKVDDMTKEIVYLKGLIEEICS